MATYKQKIIDIINNEDNKKVLNIEVPRGNLFTYFLKSYTECCIENPNKDNHKGFEELYHEINNCIKRLNYRNKFKNTWQKDLDETIAFVNEYKASVDNYKGSYKQTINKKLNNSIEDYNFNLHKTIINEIKIDFDFEKNIETTAKIKGALGMNTTFRKKTNAEALLKLYKKYKKELEASNIDLRLFA